MNNSVIVPYEEFHTRRLLVESEKLLQHLTDDIRNCNLLNNTLQTIAEEAGPRDAVTINQLSNLHMDIQNIQVQFAVILLDALSIRDILTGIKENNKTAK